MTDDLSKTIGELDTLRRKHGSTSDVGGICSNLIEQIKNLQNEIDRTTRANLRDGIERQQENLARLIAGNRQAGEG